MHRTRLSGLLAVPLLSASLLLSGSTVIGQSTADPSPVPLSTAQPGHDISFDGFSFTFGDDLGASVNVSTLLGGRPEGPTEPAPPSTLFSLYGHARAPKVGGQRGQVQSFRVADLPAGSYAASQLRTFDQILDRRPDLGQGKDGSPEEIPLVVDMDAAQGIRSHAAYIDTEDVTGIAFITAFAQDTYPYSSDSFQAVFQGKSVDGATVILVTLPLTTQLFPEEVPDDLVERVLTAKGWQRYQRQAARTLSGARPDAFSPSLTSFEALIDSMAFPVEPVSGPSPSATPGGG